MEDTKYHKLEYKGTQIIVAECETFYSEVVCFSAMGVIRALGLPRNTIKTYKGKMTQYASPAVLSIGGKYYFTSVFTMYLSYKVGNVDFFRWVDQQTVNFFGTLLEPDEIAGIICAKFGLNRAIPDRIKEEAEKESEILKDFFRVE